MKFCQKKKKSWAISNLGLIQHGNFFQKKKIIEGSKFYMTISIAFGFILEFCLGGMQKLECCVSDPRLAKCQEVVLTASWVALWFIYPFVADCFTLEWVWMVSKRHTMVRKIEIDLSSAQLKYVECRELGCFWCS